MQIIKKISLRTVCGIIKSPAENEKKELMVIYGTAIGSKTGTTIYGDFTGLKGNFAAINSETGEELRAGEAYLPDVALNLIMAAFKESENNAVTFGFKIFATGLKPDEKDNAQHTYSAEPLLETENDDPLTVMKKQIFGGLLSNESELGE